MFLFRWPWLGMLGVLNVSLCQFVPFIASRFVEPKKKHQNKETQVFSLGPLAAPFWAGLSYFAERTFAKMYFYKQQLDDLT